MNQIPPLFISHPAYPYPSTGGAALLSTWCFALIVLAVTWLLFGGVCARYTGLSRARVALLWLAATVMAVYISYAESDRTRNDGAMHYAIALLIQDILFSYLAFPFAARLYGKWIGGQLTGAERAPGAEGVRAWLTPGNLICAILIAICACNLFGVTPVCAFALTFGLLLAYPVLNLATATPQPAPAAPVEDLSAEREKVLRLLETGKITVDESADLLNALGHSVPSRPALKQEISSARKCVLLGAALLIAGFFLPWFVLNPGQMANDMANAMASRLQNSMQQMNPGVSMPQMNFSLPTGDVQVHADDLAHGLGWWILALGVAVAVLPFFATSLQEQLQKKVILAALGIGVFLLVYVLHDTLRYASVGVFLAVAGYVLELIGTLRERPPAN